MHYHLPGGLQDDSSRRRSSARSRRKGVMDWRDVQDRLEAATPAKNLTPLLDSLPCSQRVLLVYPVTTNISDWDAPWTQLVRRRAAQWGRALELDKRFELDGAVPPFYRRAGRIGVRGVLYEKTSRTYRHRDRDLTASETIAEHHQPSAATEAATPGPRDTPTLILGGGPAGLTAGYLLAKQGFPVIIFEAEDQVGGIAKTEVREGPGGEYRFDLGGHRFFTKVKEVDDLWHEIMREEFLKRPRMSRIYWNKKFLDYPLRGPDVIKKLGPIELTRCMLSYFWAQVKPKGREDTFEQWVSNRFGKRLFNLFFKSYTEKVWGVPTSEIRAEWAAQRIKGLSFFSAAKAAFFGNKGNEIKTLIGEFHYPRYGPGQMWETMTDDIQQARRPGAAEHAGREGRASRTAARPR